MRFVLKFGGSSLATVDKIQKIAKYIKQLKTRKDIELVIVVSANGKTTNKLINFGKRLTQKQYSQEFAELISFGENISASALALSLENIGIKCKTLSAKENIIYANGCSTNSYIEKMTKVMSKV